MALPAPHSPDTRAGTVTDTEEQNLRSSDIDHVIEAACTPGVAPRCDGAIPSSAPPPQDGGTERSSNSPEAAQLERGELETVPQRISDEVHRDTESQSHTDLIVLNSFNPRTTVQEMKLAMAPPG
jgi:hypothetical protein